MAFKEDIKFMTVNELEKILIQNDVPQNMYSLLVGGFPNEAFCLIKSDSAWEVYYSERGQKRDVKKFSSESEACEYMNKKLDKYVRA